MQFHVLWVFFIFAKVSTLNNLGCKNDLYLVMIEAHIEENPKFHKLSTQKNKFFCERNFLIYYFFGR